MKKLFLLMSLTALFFSACKEEEKVEQKDPVPAVIRGCMDPLSQNYNPNAKEDDGSCQYLASSTVQKRNVVLEEYTGVRCTFCPDGHRKGQSFADANPGKVVLINIHTGGYANPQTGWPDFTTKYGAAIASKSGMGLSGTGYPGGSISRNNFSGDASMTGYKMVAGDKYTLLNRGGWWNASTLSSPGGDIILDKDAPVNIGMKVKSYDEATREVRFMVEMYFTETITNGAKLNIALLESNIKGRQIDMGADNANYVHKHMLRDLLTGLWGELLDAGTAVKGKRIQKEYTYILPAKDKNSQDIIAENCNFAVFITALDNFDVLNATEIPVK